MWSIRMAKSFDFSFLFSRHWLPSFIFCFFSLPPVPRPKALNRYVLTHLSLFLSGCSVLFISVEPALHARDFLLSYCVVTYLPTSLAFFYISSPGHLQGREDLEGEKGEEEENGGK
jgi:hypothetical protein